MGSECRNDNEALQSASSVALFQLVNSIKSDFTGGNSLQWSIRILPDLRFLFIVPVIYPHWQLLFVLQTFEIKKVCQTQFHLKMRTFRALTFRQSELF